MFRTPSLRRHKPSQRGVITLCGVDHYCGPWPNRLKSPPQDTKAEADRLVAEWLVAGRQLPEKEQATLTISDLIRRFLEHAAQHYRRADGTPTSEPKDYRQSVRPLRDMYYRLPVETFSPLKLKAVRERMIDFGWCRNVINQRIGRIVRMFKWGVSEEIVPETVYRALCTVRGLSIGRSAAKESKPVKPVDKAHVEATIIYLLPELADAVWLQLKTGMRSGELLKMRKCEIDRSETIWVYRPRQHKTTHRGHRREVQIGPSGQQILAKYLDSIPEDEFVFSPRRAMEARRAARRATRKTKVQPSQAKRKRKKKPKKGPGPFWSSSSYAKAIAVAAELAAMPHWHPHQLRHSAATEIRREFGLDAARAVLGQRSLAVAEIYAEVDMAKAAEVATRLG